MKMLLQFIISLLLYLVVSTQTLAFVSSPISSYVSPGPTVEYNFPYVGLLPDHPLYLLKVSRDRILLFFTRDPEKKVHLNLLFSDKRLVMGQLLWEKGNIELSVTTLGKGEKYLLSAAVDLAALKKQENLPPGLSDKMELAAKKHEEVIMKLINSSDDEVKRQGLNLALGINHQATQQILSVK